MASQANETKTAFEAMGGHDTIRRVVNRFYDLMDSEPAYAELRAMHAPDLAPMRESLASFLAGWSGSPRDWFEQNPGKCMMSAHGGFAISQKTAAQWAEAMQRAIADCGPESRELGDALAKILSQLAMGMARD